MTTTQATAPASAGLPSATAIAMRLARRRDLPADVVHELLTLAELIVVRESQAHQDGARSMRVHMEAMTGRK